MSRWRRHREHERRLKQADSYNGQAEQMFLQSTERFLHCKRSAKEALSRLGYQKIELWGTSIQGYVDALKRFGNIALINISNADSADTILFQIQRNCSAAINLKQIANTSNEDSLVSIAIHGSGAVLSCASAQDAVSYLEKSKSGESVVRWLSDESWLTNRFGTGTRLSRPTKKSDAGYSSIWAAIYEAGTGYGAYSRAQQFYSQSKAISSELNQAITETQAIQRISNRLCEFISKYCTQLSSLTSDLFRIEQEYAPQKVHDKVPFTVLSDIEKRTVSIALLTTVSLCNLVYSPLFLDVNNAVVESERFLSYAEDQFSTVCSMAEALQSEKDQINSLLTEARSYYDRLVADFHSQRENLRKALVGFADYKLTIWETIGRRYFGALRKLQHVPLDQEMICIPPQDSLDTILERTDKCEERAAELSGRRAQCSENDLLAFAINSFDSENEGNYRLCQWLCGEPSAEITVDGVGRADFENVASVLQMITGKETLPQAQSILGRARTAGAGIESVNSKIGILTKTLGRYQKESDRMLKRFSGIAEQVIVITSPYESIISSSELTAQECKTVSLSWNYGQLLYRALSDSFYRPKESFLCTNDGVPDVIYMGTKTIQKRTFRYSGEAGYAADAIYKRTANNAKWITLTISLLFVIVSVLTASLIHILGLLYFLPAAVAFPYPLIGKNMPQNKLVLVRMVQFGVAIACAVAVTILLLLL